MRLIAILVLSGWALLGAEEYALGPDSQRQPGIPQGKVTQHTWASRIFPGTVRDYWIYVPAQYKPERPAAVMIFQDGAGYVREDGAWRVPTVFDNLIQKGEMPVTIGIFINPGVLPAAPDQQARYNRSFEYDGLGDRYARFLLEEILPEVGKQYNLSNDPNDRALARTRPPSRRSPRIPHSRAPPPQHRRCPGADRRAGHAYRHRRVARWLDRSDRLR